MKIVSSPEQPERAGGVDQITLDLFSSEGAPSPAEPHPQSIACPAPREGGKQRFRLPLWRFFQRPR